MGILESTIVLKAKDLTRAVFDKAKENIKGTGAEAEKGAKGVDTLGASVNKLSKEEQKLAIEQKKLENSTAKVALEQQKLDKSTDELNRSYKEANTSEQKAAVRRKQLAADTKQLSLDSKKLTNQQKALNISAKKAALGQKRLEKNTLSLDGVLKSTTSRIIAFGGAYLGLNKLKEGFLAILETGGKFETMQVQLDAVMGTVEGGETAFAWIQEFAKNTPLQLDGVTDAFVKMKALGLDPMDGTMQKLTDISSKLGGGQERLEGIILAVGQAWTKGKLQAEEANQLIERGVPVWDLMSKAVGKTTGELQDMASSGQLGREEIKLLIDEIGKSSEGAAAAQMSTWAGVISNLQDTWTTFLNSIAESGVLDYFKTQLQEVSATIREMAADGSLKEWAVSISESIIGLAKTVKSVVSTIYEYKDAIVAMAVAQAGVKFAGFLAGFVGVTAATKTATVATRGFTAALSVNPISLFVAGLLLLPGAINSVIDSYRDKKAAADDLVLAEAELEQSNEKIRQSILKRIEADKLAKESAEDYLSKIDEAVKKGNQQADQQAYLATELGKATEAAIGLSAAQEGLADETGNTSKAIAKLSDDELKNLLTKIEGVNSTDLFVGGGWDDLKNNLLHEKFKRLGVDLDVITGNATKAGRDGSQAFKDFAKSADATEEAVFRLANQLISAAKTEGDIRLLKRSFEEVGFEIANHPKLIQTIIDKNIALGGSLDDIPQKWKDIAAEYEKAKKKQIDGNDALIKSDNTRHENRLNHIEEEYRVYIAALQRKVDADRKAYEEKEKRRLASVFKAFDEDTSAAYSELTPENLALLKRAEAASNNKLFNTTFDAAAFIKKLLEKQQATKTVNVNFNANGNQAGASFNSQQDADSFMEILKTAGSVT